MFDYKARVEALQTQMGESGIDVVLLSVGADLPYFTGYEAMPSERLTVLVVSGEGQPVLYVPELEAPRVDQGEFELVSWGEQESPVDMAAKRWAPSRIGVGDQMWSVFLTGFLENWPYATWIPASEVTSPLRLVKDQVEIELLRNAANGIDRVMARIPDEVRFSGRTEADIARQLSDLAVEEGHDEAAFAIVASGPNGASPHHHAGARVVEDGDVVVCDFGGRWGGYYSDTTRTVVVGEPTTKQVEVHSVVLAANEAGRGAVHPGVSCQDVDRAARSVVEQAGYGDLFIHRTGHGIGMDVHEHPYMVEGNETALEVGMTFSVEPGIYLPGEFGVRIEDIVACGANGADTLNEAGREFIRAG